MSPCCDEPEFDNASWDEDGPETPQDRDLDDEDDDETPTVPCPSCGWAVPDFADRCPYCGDWIVQGGVTRKGGLWVVVVLLLGLSVLLWLCW